MARKSFITLLKIGSVALLLFTLLFASSGWRLSSNFTGSILREISAVLRNLETQWIVFLCLAIYFTAFFLLRLYGKNCLTQRHKGSADTAHGITRTCFWLAGALFISAVHYTVYYSTSLLSLILLFGATLGQAVAVWAGLEVINQKPEVRINVTQLIVIVLVILLTFASVWQDKAWHSYAYRSQDRLTGPWDNPNIFGLLMGVGIALAMGLAAGGAIQNSESKIQYFKLDYRSWFKFAFFLAAVGLMARGLLHSYSRGAWLATAVGLVFLIGSWLWRLGEKKIENVEIRKLKEEMEHLIRPAPAPSSGLQPPSPTRWARGISPSNAEKDSLPCVSWLKRNWVPFAMILVAAGAICLWHFRQTDWHPARRALSVVNAADFSWRNRVAAWVGDLQMMAEQPWLGTGWNQPEPLYEHYYLSPRLTESAAIQMNDYLMLGAMLGIPALFCLGIYLWLTLTGKVESGAHLIRPAATFSPSDAEKGSLDWLQTACRAGAIVLLVGFWFDGGLFKLATAATFWILLELGSVQPRMDSIKHQ